MKKTLYSLLISSMLLATSSFAQTEKALLWEVSGNGLSAPSYLFGTIHLTCAADLQVSEQLRTKVEQTEQLYLEMDMDDPKLYSEMMKYMYLPAGKSLKTLLKSEDYETVSQFFKDTLKMNIAGVERMQPFMVISLMYPKMFDCPMSQGYEMALMPIAKKAHKEVLGLETVAEQMGAIESMGMEKQAEMLLTTVKEWRKGQQELKELLKAYKAKDLLQLEKLMKESSFESQEMESSLLNNRNANWLKIMPEIMAKKSTMFAFGALHLVGENGVISLLRKAGYTVKAIE